MCCCPEIFLWIIFISSACINVCTAQETCYPPGGVAGIVVATIIVTFVVGGLGVAFVWRRWTRKTGNQGINQIHHNQNQKQSQKAQGEFAFDNPYFRDQGDGTDGLEKGKARSSLNKNSMRSSKISEYSIKTKKPRNGKFMFGGGKKHRAYDDSCLAVEPERTIVSLRGHDFTGLGFNICGNMRDGIMVKDVLHRGPASESGLIKAGDKILNVTVSFTNIVYEDALTILSYASPYDVQLEIERIPDKSRSTPTSSKRLGSCSFNNSGQKLFHPLYRSQSIDDLTQIDKDTFPSHGIGPRRSQSIGVAAHKLAAHFKNSDSKLEDKDRNPMSLVLSTTGSLNEKMLANVMSDGNLHKNGLQWEKRFEDTLESEDSSNASRRNSSNDDKTQGSHDGSSTKSILHINENSSSKINQTQTTPQSYKQKNSKYLDSPYNKEKLEIHKAPIDKSDIDGSISVQVHQPERMSGRRVKNVVQTTGTLWQHDQSANTEDNSSANNESTHYSKKTAIKKDNYSNRFASREEGNESDVSRDSLEVSSLQAGGKKLKQNPNSSNETVKSIDLSPSVMKTHYQLDRKNVIQSSADVQPKLNAERVYDNNVINKHNALIGNAEHRMAKEKTSHSDTKSDIAIHSAEGAAYSNHRNSPSTVNNRDNFSPNFSNKTRVTVNGQVNDHPNRIVMNSAVSPTYVQKVDADTRLNENNKHISANQQQVFAKKTSNPGGMFTQISPFQMPSKPKNVNLKPWVGREETNRQSPLPTNELQQSRGNYVTISDSSSQPNRRNPLSDGHSYNQRMNDRTKTVIMSSYDNNAYGGSNSNVHNFQNSNYKQHH